MIRFVDVRHAKIGGRFSFYNTVTDEYIGANQEFVWNNWIDFEDFNQFFFTGYPSERFKSLCPAWIFEEITE